MAEKARRPAANPAGTTPRVGAKPPQKQKKAMQSTSQKRPVQSPIKRQPEGRRPVPPRPGQPSIKPSAKRPMSPVEQRQKRPPAQPSRKSPERSQTRFDTQKQGKPQKKRKEREQKNIVVQSTQSFIPIKDIRNGVIITEDNRYIRIIEFAPINFLLRSAVEQASIIDSFTSMLKIAPSRIQFKSFSKKADKERFLAKLRQDYRNEKNPKCRELLKEYMHLVSTVADAEGVSRRFFMIVEYEAEVRNNDFDYISRTLNTTVNAICGYMRQCGNDVISGNSFLGEDVKQLEILYELLNRSRAENVPFDKHYPQIVKRYVDYTQRSYSEPPFIPVTEFFAPKSIDLAASSKYIIVDGKYYTFAYIPTKNFGSAEYAGWLSYLSNAGEGIDVDVFLEKVPKERAQSSAARQIRFKRLALKDTEDTNADYEELNEAIGSAFYIKQGLSNNEDLYYMSVLITVVGNSEEEVEYKFRELNRISTSYDKKLKRCRWQMEQAFLSSLPLARLDRGIQKKAKRNVLTSSAASTYLFSSFEICDEDGILFGINKSNRSLAVVDIFNTTKYTNANMAIVGTSGAGKTFTMQCIATRMREKGIQVFIIPPLKGHEFKRACDNIGGQYVNISAGSPHRINIMEIRPLDEEAQRLIDGDDMVRSRLADKAGQVGIFVALLVPDMSMEEKQLLDDAIIRTYAEKGITNDNSSLYKNGKSGEYKEMPILEDLYNQLKKDPKTDRIANILNLLVHGSASSFNGRTNVNLDNKYIVLDISNLSKSLQTVGMYVALDYVWDKIKEDRTKRKAVFLDELWALIGTSSNPMAANFVLEIFKTIRGYGGAAIAATQDLNDFFALDNGSYGKGIINNSQTKIILKLTKDEALFVRDILGLTQTETMAVMKFERGNGLLATNSNNVFIEFKAGKLETELITTDRTLLEQIASERKALGKAGRDK